MPISGSSRTPKPQLKLICGHPHFGGKQVYQKLTLIYLYGGSMRTAVHFVGAFRCGNNPPVLPGEGK